MALDLTTEQPGRILKNLTLSSTTSEMTLVYLPQWVGQVTVRPQTYAAKWVDASEMPQDAVLVGARAVKSLAADTDRVFVFRASPSRPQPTDWRPQFALCSSTASVVVEIEIEPWF